MKGAKEFFEELQEGDEYAVVLMRKEQLLQLEYEEYYFKIHQKANFESDEVYLQLKAEHNRAKARLEEYEFKKIHKI